MVDFTNHLWRELDVVEGVDNFSHANVHAVYIGGGTGSLMPCNDIARLVHELRGRFGLRDAEVTLECEPGTKTLEDFLFLREAGINRVSVGIQAFQEDLLRLLNRAYTVEQAVSMVEAAKAAGFENVHIDLMFGLPGQTLPMWRESMDRTVELEVPHVSAYPLIVFHDELLDRKLRAGDSPPRPEVGDIDRMRVSCQERFGQAGLVQYSLTEFSRPGHRCNYVIDTWDGSDYLGFGPAAYSRNGRSLWENDVIHVAYDRMVGQGRRPVGKSIVMTPQDQLRRDLAMSLCMLSIDVSELERRAGITVEDNFAEIRDGLVADGLLRVQASKWSLTEAGVRYATEVMKRFAA
jgi:oxygen-independent coproporphyrinogen-3 oxidase